MDIHYLNNKHQIYSIGMVCILSLLFICLFMNNAMAEEEINEVVVRGNILSQFVTKLSNLFKKTRLIIFVIGGFGLVGIAFQASFGRMKWSWFAGLAVGLAIVAVANAIIKYATGRTPVRAPDTLTAEAVEAEASGSEGTNAESSCNPAEDPTCM